MIIDLLQQEPEHALVLNGLYNEVRTGDRLIFTSALTIAELGGNAASVTPARLRALEDLFLQHNVIVVNLDRFVAHKAREIRNDLIGKRKLPGNDAIHLATALSIDVNEMFTYDDNHLTPLNDQFAGKSGYSLSIVYPHWDGSTMRLPGT